MAFETELLVVMMMKILSLFKHLELDTLARDKQIHRVGDL
jgi:hypothetical protein